MIEFMLFAIWLELTGLGQDARHRIKLNRRKVRWYLLAGYVVVFLLVKGLV